MYCVVSYQSVCPMLCIIGILWLIIFLFSKWQDYQKHRKAFPITTKGRTQARKYESLWEWQFKFLVLLLLHVLQVDIRMRRVVTFYQRFHLVGMMSALSIWEVGRGQNYISMKVSQILSEERKGEWKRWKWEHRLLMCFKTYQIRLSSTHRYQSFSVIWSHTLS